MAKRTRQPTQAGFALIEILLVAMLLVLFTSSAVMSLAPLWQGARLEEGVGQLESLLRFARAEAAQQGRRHELLVQALVAAETGGGVGANPTAIQVRWEPEPLDQPGLFVESLATAALARSVTEHVRVEQVRRLESAVAPAGAATPTAADPSGAAPPAEPPTLASLEEVAGWPPIRFYPDGSSDSAEILVGSADLNDSRRMLVKWNGLSGTAARQELDPEDLRLLGIGNAEAQPLEPASVARTAVGHLAP